MSTEHDEMIRIYPEARQLFGQFGEDYDYEYDKDERAAIDDYVDGNSFVGQGIKEINELLQRFPDNETMRDALFHLGVKWTMWDQDDDWVPFVHRVRGWLVDSQTSILGGRSARAPDSSTSASGDEGDQPNYDSLPFDPTAEEALLRAAYPEATLLFDRFGMFYAHDFAKNEEQAVDDYLEHSTTLTDAVTDLDALLERFPDTESMRAALKRLGVKWSVWDKGEDWVPFVRRVRARLAAALSANPADQGHST